MANEVVQLSVTKIIAGDWILLESQARSIRIDIVASDKIALQALETTDVPINERTQVALDRMAEAFLDSPFVDQAEVIQGNLIQLSISDTFSINVSQDSGFQVDTSNGSNMGWVSYVNTDGVRYDINNPSAQTDFIEPLIDNIRITNVTHKLLDYSWSSLRENVYGNIGNRQKTTIYFDAAETFDSIAFKYNYVDNDLQVYTLPDDFTIVEGNFQDPYLGNVIRFVADTTSLAVSGNVDFEHTMPRNGTAFESCKIYRTDTLEYYIEYIHYLPVLPREDDYSNRSYTVPQSVRSGKSLKPIFQIDATSDPLSASPEQSTNRVDLSNFFDRGSIGYYNEKYKTGIQLFEPQNLVYEFGDTIDSGKDSKITFDIKNIKTNFSTSDELRLYVSMLDVLGDQTKDRVFNTRQNSVLIQANGIANTSTRFTDFKADIDGTDPTIIHCEVTVPRLSITGRFVIWCGVSQGLLNSHPVFLDFNVADTGFDDSVVNLDFFSEDAQRPDYNFLAHWQTDPLNVSTSFNHVVGSVEDLYTSKFRVVNSDSSNTTLIRSSVSIKRRTTGEIIPNTEYQFDIVNGDRFDKGYKVPNAIEDYRVLTSEFNYGFDVDKDEYIFNIPFIISPEMYPFDDLVFEWEGYYSQVLATGETVSGFARIQSPDFKLINYNETGNTDTEPQAEIKSVKYYNDTTGLEVSSIILDGVTNTRVEFTFEDNNLNDLQNIPDGPYPLVLTPDTLVIGSLVGYLNIIPKGQAFQDKNRYHTKAVNNGVFWSPVSGYAYDNAKLTVVNQKTATIEGVINGKQLIDTYPNATCFDISARLDKVQESIPLIDPESDIYAIIDTTSFLGTNSAKIAEVRVKSWFLNYVRSKQSSGTPYNGNLYIVYPQSGSSFDTGIPRYGNERFLNYFNSLMENEELVDLSDSGIAAATNNSGTPIYTSSTSRTNLRKMSYICGLITCMRASDITDNTFVSEVETDSNPAHSGLITRSNSDFELYYSSFFDDNLGSITNKEFIIDFFSKKAITLTVNGVNHVADTVSNVYQYNDSYTTIDPAYDRANLTFRGINNTYDFDFGSGIETITPSKKVLFIGFIDDQVGFPDSAESYCIYDTTSTVLVDNINNNTMSTNDNLPTWIYRQDYDLYVSNTHANLTKQGSIIYSPQGVNRSKSDSIAFLGSGHVHIIRSVNGDNISLSEFNKSTFLREVDIDALNQTGVNNYLTDNSNYTGFNNLSLYNSSYVIDYGSYDAGQGLLQNVTQTEFNNQIFGAINKINQ